MKEHPIATVAAALLLTATSYAGAESIAAPPARSQEAARFADDIARLQALSSNSSAFMQHPGARDPSTAAKAPAAAAKRMAAARPEKPEQASMQAPAAR